MIATQEDVELRLGRPLTIEEAARVPGLMEEAEILIEGYLGELPEFPDRAIVVVASRMVSRVLEAPTDGFSTESTSYTAGPFGMTKKYAAGASGGAPWLTASDKASLSRFGQGRGRGIFTIGLS